MTPIHFKYVARRKMCLKHCNHGFLSRRLMSIVRLHVNRSGESLSLSMAELVHGSQRWGVRSTLVAVWVLSLRVYLEDCGSAHIPFLLRAVRFQTRGGGM